MERRKWPPEQKALIVLEGLQGRPIGELCNEHGISQAHYYQWRDRFLGNAHLVFETANTDKRTQRLESENTKLKGLVGELTLELKNRTAGREEAWLLRQGDRSKTPICCNAFAPSRRIILSGATGESGRIYGSLIN